MLSFVERWLKSAALEAQEYVRLTVWTLRGVVTRPIYFHDIVEQFDATTAIPPGWHATVDGFRNLVLSKREA